MAGTEEGVVSGPFGKYPHGSTGAVLNTLCTVYDVPLTRVENLQIGFSGNYGIGTLVYQNETVGHFKWFKGINHACIRFMHSDWNGYGKQSRWVVNEKGLLTPKFKLTLGVHYLPTFEIEGEYATEDLYAFINYPMFSNYMDEPCYRLTKDSGAFFQGGSHDPKGGWFIIEFWRPEGAQAWLEYLNTHYVHRDFYVKNSIYDL